MIVLERIFYFIIVLGILVFVHELGHFLAAKAFGVRVLTFSLGFGRRIAGFRRGHTDYRLAMIPLGGYVRMAGEIFDEGTSMEPDHFTAKPRWQRVAVYLAGPAMNIVLAIALWWALFASGVPVNTPGGQPVIERVLPGSSADRAGLVAGDRIVAIDGREIEDAQEYGEVIAFGARRSLAYRIERGDATLDLQVEIDAHPVHGVGVDGVITQSPTVVSAVVAGSPAESAGLRAGDRIVLVDEEPVGGSQRFIALVSESAGAHPRLAGRTRRCGGSDRGDAARR
ncbi:MAG: RIP metalloprotease RseP [Acidobacteria bacterium]|nr:RIP metalloprotease RseP [Acidobacteriota bacterium]